MGKNALGNAIDKNLLDFPNPTPGHKDEISFPYTLVADEGFALKMSMMALSWHHKTINACLNVHTVEDILKCNANVIQS